MCFCLFLSDKFLKNTLNDFHLKMIQISKIHFFLLLVTVAAYAIPWDEFDQYDERRLKDFIANTVAPAARFGEAAAQQIQSKIFDFYCGNASANDNHFYLQKYTQVFCISHFFCPAAAY